MNILVLHKMEIKCGGIMLALPKKTDFSFSVAQIWKNRPRQQESMKILTSLAGKLEKIPDFIGRKTQVINPCQC